MAERLREQVSERAVLVAFFDAEEPPYFLSQAMGSAIDQALQSVTVQDVAGWFTSCGYDSN